MKSKRWVTNTLVENDVNKKTNIFPFSPLFNILQANVGLLQYKGMHLEEVVWNQHHPQSKIWIYLVSDVKLGVLPLGAPGRIVSYIISVSQLRKDVQGLLQVFIDFHNCCLITASIAVIWSGKYCYDVLILRPIESLQLEQSIGKNWASMTS